MDVGCVLPRQRNALVEPGNDDPQQREVRVEFGLPRPPNVFQALPHPVQREAFRDNRNNEPVRRHVGCDGRRRRIGCRVEENVQRTKPLVVEKLTKYNKFLTTPREKLELERLAAHVSGALGVSVKASQLIRACLIQLLHAEHDIIRRAGQHPEPKRPSNTEAVALAEFDNLLAEMLSQAFRDAGPIKFRK